MAAPSPGAEERAQRTPVTPGGSPAHPDTAAPPPIPDHELIRLIARGSYGEVWLARSALGTWRAVKIVHRRTFWHDHPFEREFKGIQEFEPVSRSHAGSELQARGRERRGALARTAGLALTMVAMLALFGSLVLSTLRHRLRTIPAAGAEPVSIFVRPFRYSARTAEPLDETERSLWLAGRITDAFIDGLALIPGVSTGPRKSDWLRFEEDEVRRSVVRTNATRYLLSGRVAQRGGLAA